MGVVDHDVLCPPRPSPSGRLQNLVGGSGIDIVGTGKHPAFDANLIHQVVDGGYCLLVGRGAGIEHILEDSPLHTDRIEEQAVQLLDYRQDRFA